MDELDIRNPFPGARSYFVAATASTQEEARRLAASGLAPGSLVAADHQSAGRGRFPARRWESEGGLNLLFTIWLEGAAAALPGLPIRIGLALREAALGLAAELGAEFPSPPLIKWPNDLMLGDRKAAGILCEAGPSGVFAGIGLNCNQRAFPPELDGRATSLALELGRELDRWRLLELFLARLYLDVAEGRRGLWREEAQRALWKRGELVAFLPGLAARGAGNGAIEGRIEGLDESGSLLIHAQGEAEPRSFAAGELTATPPPYTVVS